MRDQAVLRQLSEQNRCLPTGRNALQQTGQVLPVVVVLSSPDGDSARMTDGLAEVLGAGLVGPEPVAVMIAERAAGLSPAALDAVLRIVEVAREIEHVPEPRVS